jgi:hypothetical protein
MIRAFLGGEQGFFDRKGIIMEGIVENRTFSVS